jgi:hypothetical protein
MRKQTYQNQPTDDVLEIIKKLVEMKRSGGYEEANQRYTELAANEKNDNHNYPYILKSWAKVIICLGEYKLAIDTFRDAADLFQFSGNNGEAWQCRNHANTVKNRNEKREDFISYIQSVSGGSLNYPKNF